LSQCARTIAKRSVIDGQVFIPDRRSLVLGDTPLEAEVTAVDEAEAKSCAVTATLERLGMGSFEPLPSWNPVIILHWDSREAA
jgi:hypothetical protein